LAYISRDRQTFIDETKRLFNGELYTILTNNSNRKERAIVAMVAALKVDSVIVVIAK
jgi:hypothetical protein